MTHPDRPWRGPAVRCKLTDLSPRAYRVGTVIQCHKVAVAARAAVPFLWYRRVCVWCACVCVHSSKCIPRSVGRGRTISGEAFVPQTKSVGEELPSPSLSLPHSLLTRSLSVSHYVTLVHTYSLILTHLLSQPFSHILTQSLPQLPTHCIMHSHTESLTVSVTNSLEYLFSH